jgi:hypothetical protein
MLFKKVKSVWRKNFYNRSEDESCPQDVDGLWEVLDDVAPHQTDDAKQDDDDPG